MSLKCECGEPVIVTDDAGSIGCSAECGWEGITVELITGSFMERDIEWVS